MYQEQDEGLRNGFVEVAQLDKHHLNILGLRALLWAADPNNENSRTRKLILTWDEKNIILWEHGKLLRQLKLGGFEGKGISAMAFIPPMRVFIAATFNMTFIFYDYSLKVLETVRHSERMVTDIEFDAKQGHLIISGSGGLSVWKVIKKQLERRSSYLIEKLFSFEDFSNWSSHMSFEKETGLIYALNENTMTVLRSDARKIIDQVTESSVAPLTKCCWYEKSKFYITASAAGALSCWSSSAQLAMRDTAAAPSAERTAAAGCLLRHSLKPHTKAITGLAVHPVTDFVYTASLDGYMKIINLETLVELFSISMAVPVTNFTLMPGTFGADYLCVLGLQSGLIRVWTSKKCSDVVATLDSRLVHIAPHITPHYLKNELLKKQSVRRRRHPDGSDDESDGEDLVLTMADQEIARDGEEEEESGGEDDATGTDWSSRPHTALRSDGSGVALQKDAEEELYLEGQVNLQFARNTQETGFFVSQTMHNMRIWESSGKLVSIIGEDAIVDGVRSYSISLKHKALYCLMEDRSLRVYDLDKEIPAGTHVEDADSPRRVIPGNHFGVVDFPCCVCIVECIPSKSSAKEADFSKSEGEADSGSVGERSSVDDLRHDLMAAGGEGANVVHDESLVVGGSVGTFRWLDTAIGLREIATTEAAAGSIGSMRYDSSRGRLFAYACSLRDASAGSINVFALPSVALLYVIERLERVSYWNISVQHPYVAIGTSDGYLRLFHLLELKPESNVVAGVVESAAPTVVPFGGAAPAASKGDTGEDKAEKERAVAAGDVFEVVLGDTINVNGAETILPQSGSSTHAARVTCVSFCDSLPCVATSSIDCTVRVWSLDKILLQSIKFDYPIESICFSPYHEIGDIIVTQQVTSLLLKAKVLDLEVLIDAATLLREDWLKATLSENVTETDVRFLEFTGNLLRARAPSARPGLPPVPSSRESRRGSADSVTSSRPSSTSSYLALLSRVKANTPTIALNVRRPPTTVLPQYRSERLPKKLPSPKPRAAENVNVSNSTGSLSAAAEKEEGERPAEVVVIAPQAPDQSSKPSSAGVRKRVAFRA